MNTAAAASAALLLITCLLGASHVFPALFSLSGYDVPGSRHTAEHARPGLTASGQQQSWQPWPASTEKHSAGYDSGALTHQRAQPNGASLTGSGQRTVAQAQRTTKADQRKRYLVYEVCKGFCNQLSAFLDGIILAYMLNATAVLPDWFSHYSTDPDGQARYDRKAQVGHRVPMAYFWDLDHFMQQLEHTPLSVARELPRNMAGRGHPYHEPKIFDTSDPGALRSYRVLLAPSSVLRLKCGVNMIRWTTPELGALRARVLAALRPSAFVAAAVEERRAAIQALLAPAGLGGGMARGQYVALHLRNEADWVPYCRQQPAKAAYTWVDTFEQCYYNASRAAAALAQIMGADGGGAYSGKAWKLAPAPKVLYVATGVLTADDARAIMRATGFRAVANEQVVCVRGEGAPASSAPCHESRTSLEDKRELRAAVDLQVLAGGFFFAGNVFSSMSFVVRLSKYLARGAPLGGPNDALYYNADLASVALDVSKMEARRFSVFGGTMQPELYTDPAMALRASQLLRLHAQGRCLHTFQWGPECEPGAGAAAGTGAAAPAPLAAAGGAGAGAGGEGVARALEVYFSSTRVEFGRLVVEGRVRMSLPRFYPYVHLYADGERAGGGRLLASRYVSRGASEDHPLFKAWVALPRGGPRGAPAVVRLLACSVGVEGTGAGSAEPVCSIVYNATVQPRQASA